MIIANTDKFLTSHNSIKELYHNLVLSEISKQEVSKSIPLQQFYKLYTKEELLKALDIIYVDGKGNIVSPEHNKESIILRYLEFGGENIKPTHILSLAAEDLKEYYGMEGI